MDIGSRIKLFRQNKKISREALANRLGLSKHAIAKYEQGQRTPDAKLILKIADALDVTVNDLIGNEEIEEVKEIDLSSIPTKDLIKELNKRNDFKVTLGVVSDE